MELRFHWLFSVVTSLTGEQREVIRRRGEGGAWTVSTTTNNNNNDTRPRRGFGQQFQDTPVSTTAEPLQKFVRFAADAINS